MLPFYVIAALKALAMTSALPVGPESAEICIRKFEEETMKNVEVPFELSELIRDLRKLNPILGQFSLIKFADSAMMDKRIVETGLVTESELDKIVDLCASFVSKIYPNGEKPCDTMDYMQDYNSYETFLEVAAKHPEFDTKMGTARLCVQL